MTRERGQHCRIDAKGAQSTKIFGVKLLIKKDFSIQRTDHPAIVLDLGFELSRGPTGIAEGEDGILRTLASGDGLEDVDGGGEPDLVSRRDRALDGFDRYGVQDEAAAGFNRTTAR